MSRTVLPLAALSALLLLALAVPRTAAMPANDPQCSQYSDCYHCTSAPSGECGWEQDSQMCVRGKSSGPKNGSSYSWVWKTDQCCQHYSCTSCVGYTHCGWDGNQGSCSAGNWDGAYNPNIGGYSTWVYDSTAACPSTCESITDCNSCLANGNCVWGEGSCMGGSNWNGPYDTYGYSGNWHAYSCPATWNWEWTTRSIPVWLTFGCPALLACCAFFVGVGRRRRRILCEQQRLARQQATSYPQPAAAPLLGSTNNNAEAAAPEAAAPELVDGVAPPMPYYGAVASDVDDPGAKPE